MPGPGAVNCGAAVTGLPPRLHIWGSGRGEAGCEFSDGEVPLMLKPQVAAAVAAGEGQKKESAAGGGMRGDRWSTDGVLWWEEEDDAEAAGDDEVGWKCWKHPSQPRYGVCPSCLRDRLLRLCPDCASARPCVCFASSSSSSSSFSSRSSADFARSGGAGIGAVGPVARLIESEPSFRRSQSAGFQLFGSRSTAAGDAEAAPRPRGGKGWGPFWPSFWKAPARKPPAEAKLCRSRSVAAERPTGAGRGGGREEGVKSKGHRWHFPSPIKVFRHRKSTTNAVPERSPLWRGSRAFTVGGDVEEVASCLAIRRDGHMAMGMDW